MSARHPKACGKKTGGVSVSWRESGSRRAKASEKKLVARGYYCLCAGSCDPWQRIRSSRKSGRRVGVRLNPFCRDGGCYQRTGGSYKHCKKKRKRGRDGWGKGQERLSFRPSWSNEVGVAFLLACLLHVSSGRKGGGG